MAVDDPATTSHLRFKTPARREELGDPESWEGEGGPPPSTLPPAPFERESDVADHEWWLEAHMNAAANVLHLEQLVDVVMDSADVLEVDRVRSVIARLADVRDALYELYCDAADPRMHAGTSAASPLTAYIARLYEWCALVNDRLAIVTSSLRHAAADWGALVSAPMPTALFEESTRSAVRTRVHASGVDFTSHVEPLRNLPKDVEQMFIAAVELRAALRARGAGVPPERGT
jgi:hypothetical protein